MRVASRDAERLKTQNFRKLGNFKKIPEKHGADGMCPAHHQKPNFNSCARKHYEKNVQKRSFSGPYCPIFGLNTDQKNSIFKQFLCSKIAKNSL